MRLLGIETALEEGFVFLGSETAVISSAVLARRSGASQLAPAVAHLLHEQGLSFASLDTIAVSLGPGSFTGVRIGISFAKALAWAGSLDMVGVPTLEAVAATYPGEGSVCAVIAGYRGCLFGRFYRKSGQSLAALSEHLFLPLKEFRQYAKQQRLMPTTFVSSHPIGDGQAQKSTAAKVWTQGSERMESFRRQAIRGLRCGNVVRSTELLPIYVMPPLIHGKHRS